MKGRKSLGCRVEDLRQMDAIVHDFAREPVEVVVGDVLLLIEELEEGSKGLAVALTQVPECIQYHDTHQISIPHLC